MSEVSERGGRVQVPGGPAPARIVRAGRSLITRAELARLSGLSVSTLAGLYAQRARTSHPPAVITDPLRGTLYFDEEQVLRWHHTRRRPARTPPVRALDVSGDPDELVTMTEAARILGYRSAATIRSYRARFDDYFPPPDRIDPRGGQHRRLWRRSSIWEFSQRRAETASATPRENGSRPRDGDDPGAVPPCQDRETDRGAPHAGTDPGAGCAEGYGAP